MKSSLNSFGRLLSPYSNYERRGDISMANVSHNTKLTQVNVFDSTLLLNPLALMPWNHNITKSQEGYK